ncbi:unnamed protein product, partial [Oppiella nova]
MSAKSAVNGLNSCKCCPYGFHIDTDFVNYCEVLLTALYGSPSDKRLSQTLQCRTSNSFRRKINSAFSTLNSRSAQSAATDAFLSYCDYNYNISGNRLNSQHNKLKSQSPKENHCLDKESINSVINDYSLGDVVDEFEETWNESNRRLSNSSDCEPIMKSSLMADSDRGVSPPSSPAPSSCTSSNVSRVVLSQIRDQMAFSLTRVKELENQVKTIPNLKQRVIVLREEKRKLMKRLEGESDDCHLLNDPQNKSRVRELEKSGLITPPMMRRKLLLKSDSDTEDDEFDDIWVRCSPPPEKLVSSKNIRLEELSDRTESRNSTKRKSLEMVSQSTSTEDMSRTETIDCSTNTDEKLTNKKHLSLDVLSSISITPEMSPVVPLATTAPAAPVLKRSIGISTSLAPSLPRKSIAIETDLKAIDTISIQELEAKRPALVSWGTDPIRVVYTHSQTQASPKCCDVSTRTETPALRNAGVVCTSKDFGLKVNWTQTESKHFHNKTVQCSQSCPKCELKQTETIGVGDNNVFGIVTGIDKSVTTERERPTNLDGLYSTSPVSRASSAQSIRLCDKCNDAITSVAKDFVSAPHEKISSPTIQSRIPRPIQSTGSLERRTINDKIIEETGDEILVYKNPSLSVGSSPLKRNSPIKIPELSPKTVQRQFRNRELLSPKTSHAINLIDDVLKISESDESEDESSSSSDEGTYEVETGAVAKPVSRTRVDPSQEIKAALKVLNDNLVKPEKANKSALIKSLAIIEKEWFKVAADKESDFHCVEDYIDCFEKFSKHLLNRVVNLDDKSGNTAIHYAISLNNFDIVSVLLDSKVCDAGYTATMLVSLSKVDDDTQKAVIRRLFQLGDVNIKAKQ